MAIIGFLNGYYRTGTTIVWWILQQSNPDIVILYEPHSVGLYNEFRTLNPQPDTVNPLHRLPIYKPYFMVEPEIKEEYHRNVRPKPVYTKEDFEDAVESIEMFDKSKKRIVIQSNQLHLILNDIAEYFDCNYIHMVRDPAEILYSHAESPSKLKAKIQQILITHLTNFMISKWMNHGKTGKFEIRYTMSVARKLGWINGGDLLEKFVKMYVNYNYHVLENLSKRGKIVRFEDLVRSEKLFRRVFQKLNLNVRSEFNTLDPKKAFKAPSRLKNKISKRLDSETRRKLEVLGYEY